jgi:adenosylcobinamide-GDP ribazoletransferase
MAWAAGRPDWQALAIALLFGALTAIVLLSVFGLAALIGILLAAAGVGLFSHLSHRQIGGHTGDTVGAAQQIGEALLLAGLTISWPTALL